MSERHNIISVSGGKDSVATWLWALRTGLKNVVAVYQDTHWEWDEDLPAQGGHYAYLDLLEREIGPIHRTGASNLDGTPTTFEEKCEQKSGFPGRVRKWCTEELKLKPMRDWLDNYRDEHEVDVQVLLGIRREESLKRANEELTKEREFSDFYDCEVWRPILDWKVADVILELKRHGIPMHPLYHHGAERVGCFPCINAGKAELRLVAELQPSRVDRIRALEKKFGATMFVRDRRTEKKRLEAQGLPGGPSVEPLPIDDVMKWAMTKFGGKEIQLEKAKTGCARWGICELPAPEKK